jgi:hypothetical protein
MTFNPFLEKHNMMFPFTEMAREALQQPPDPICAAMQKRQQEAKEVKGPDYIAGLDLGQARDFTALSILKRTECPHPEKPERMVRHYAVVHLQRWKLNTEYTDIVADLAQLCARPELPGGTLVVDATGCGRPVVDMIAKAGLRLRIARVTIHGGHAANYKRGEGWFVPKKDLVATMQALVQANRFQVLQTLPEAPAFGRELQNFRVKVNLTNGNETYEAWRDRDHDDLVLSVALACWFGERGLRRLSIW